MQLGMDVIPKRHIIANKKMFYILLFYTFSSMALGFYAYCFYMAWFDLEKFELQIERFETFMENNKPFIYCIMLSYISWTTGLMLYRAF